jgi:hypothetical membrane protein
MSPPRTTPIPRADQSSVRWWAVASAAVAPFLLVGGWTLAAARQPPGYDPIRDTISSLAARGATDRWLMTAALFAVGACYVVTGAGLRPARGAGRIALIGGGVATAMVAAFPQPVRGNGVSHTIAATIAFTALAAWPVLAVRRRSGTPVLSLAAAVSATVVMVGFLAWFTLELHGSHRGIAERGAALAEVAWPLVVAVGARHAQLARRAPSIWAPRAA